MATYALTFATRAAFDTSLASGDIYNLMQGVTSSKPSVAITATITESGETFACGTNVMVDIKSVGPGDYVMYDSTNNKFFGIASKWIDNNYPAQPTQHIMIFKAGVLPARYVVCGTVIKRFGNRIRIAGDSEERSFAGGIWAIETIAPYGEVVKKARMTSNSYNINVWCALPSLRYTESLYPNGHVNYWPITRSVWNAAVVAGDATVTQNDRTVTLADYDFSFDKWVSLNFSPLWPAASGAYNDYDGIGNTKKIVEAFVAEHGKTQSSTDYAAGYCYNYAINAPGLGKHQWFLGVLKDVGEIRALTHTLLTPLAWNTVYLRSSTLYLGGDAWYVNYNGMTDWRNGPTGDTNYRVIPLADLILEN